MSKITVLCPAKITPLLYVGSLRRDGFHEVRLALFPINLYDRLVIKKIPSPRIDLIVTGGFDLGTPEHNLVYRAAQMWQKASHVEPQWQVILNKSIPPQAGLGGGSANAAATLQVLNTLYDKPLNASQLLELAQNLGSDVPFFLKPRPTLAWGRGELLEPLVNPPQLCGLLIIPRITCNTAEMYAKVKIEKELPATLASKTLTATTLLENLYNSFEAYFFSSYPHLNNLRSQLYQLGAMGVVLNGSGSTFSAFFNSSEQRQKARYEMPNDIDCIEFNTLNTHDYLAAV